MRCHAVLQGIFPIQRLNLGLLPCRQRSLPSEAQGNFLRPGCPIIPGFPEIPPHSSNLFCLRHLRLVSATYNQQTLIVPGRLRPTLPQGPQSAPSLGGGFRIPPQTRWLLGLWWHVLARCVFPGVVFLGFPGDNKLMRLTVLTERKQALGVPASDSQVYTLTRALWRQVPFCFPNWAALIVAISGQEGGEETFQGERGVIVPFGSPPLVGSFLP